MTPHVNDTTLEEILGWSKSVALAQGDKELDVHHLVLGALLSKSGKNLLADIIQSDLPLKVSKWPALYKKTTSKVTAPVSDQKLPLAPRLKEVTSNVIRKAGLLSPVILLQETLESLRSDETWGKPLLEAASRLPRQTLKEKPELLRSVLKKLEELRSALNSRIVGQDAAIEQVCGSYFPVLLKENVSEDVEKLQSGPKVIFTFVGPPGCGKTLMAETLSEYFSRTERAPCLRLNMSAYSTHQAHEQLVGFSSAYKGADKGILTGFVEENPEGFVLIDEIEKSHRNTQNLFLQVLDSGQLYENNKQKFVDFSKTTFIFTTNLGRDLYDSPNRTGVLQDSSDLDSVILEALGREGASTGGDPAGPAGLPPELISRLAKGSAILFRHLDGLAMERLAAFAFREVSAEMLSSSGLSLIIDDIVSTLLILRFGTGGDARRLKAGLRNYLFSLLGKIIKDHGELFLSKPFKGFSLSLAEKVELPDSVQSILAAQTRILLIDEDPWESLASEKGFNCRRVSSHADVDQELRGNQADFVLLDLHIHSEKNKDDRDAGLAMLRWLRSRYPDVPVYLFSENPELRGMSHELLERVRLQGGARGILQKKFYGNDEQNITERDSFFRRLTEIEALVKRQKIVDNYQRSAKIIDFDVQLRPNEIGVDGQIFLDLRRIREVVAVSAVDRGGLGWVELPRDRFDDVVGVENVKERLKEVSAWLVRPQDFVALGVEPPKGILLTGPPGTGKTTLARAVAGEAKVPFFAVSATEFLNKYVGQSEMNVRELFTRARRYAPSIIFIDEIDSIGQARSASGDSNNFRTGLLNELLAQMDGFRQGDRPVFILAATNRVDILDRALLRPGRFDLQIEVPIPDRVTREGIFKFHLRQVPLAGEVEIASLADRMSGMSGAHIKQVCKEAAMLAFRSGCDKVTNDTLHEAVTNISLGLANGRSPLTGERKKATAVHEAGHALAQLILLPQEPVSQISILPRGKALGFVEHTADEINSANNRIYYHNKIMVLLAGRAAEEVMLGPDNISAGCVEDLERASALAMAMIGNWGMDPTFGNLSISGLRRGIESGPGAVLALENMAAEQAKLLLEDLLLKVRDLLDKECGKLEKLTEELLSRETMYGVEITHLVGI